MFWLSLHQIFKRGNERKCKSVIFSLSSGNDLEVSSWFSERWIFPRATYLEIVANIAFGLAGPLCINAFSAVGDSAGTQKLRAAPQQMITDNILWDRVNIPEFPELRLQHLTKTPRMLQKDSLNAPETLRCVGRGWFVDTLMLLEIICLQLGVSESGMGRFWGDISMVHWVDEDRKSRTRYR